MSGTQACCLCGQRVCNPLNPKQRTACPLAAQVKNLGSAEWIATP
jgi:hypothetical protein